MEEKRYLVQCHSVEECSVMQREFEKLKMGNIIPLNNFDGTFDFIVKCSMDLVSHMKNGPNAHIRILPDAPFLSTRDLLLNPYTL